jgi:predicted homoserine dehydrogenase-like protein
LEPGEILDGPGGFMTYALTENAETSTRERLLPIGLSEGRRLVQAVARDEPLAFAAVEPRAPRAVDSLYDEQLRRFTEADSPPVVAQGVVES